MTVVVTSVALLGAVMTARSVAVQADEEEKAEPAPPAGQTYTGAKRCASCHFQQFMAWKKTGHAKSFDLLTAEYEKDPKCLKCHTTGYGEDTGYKDDSDAALKGTTCEACHGPGSEHEEVCQAFKNKKLNEEEEKLARDTIWLMIPKNICVECHAVQAHKESETPKELRK
jgi:hypothetical protein